ncbi:MAG: putative Ni/Fe-hydrogenase B-type cytochrome subunit [Stenotrophomonas maltophilia]|nr:MAG: putative Ni/Fe-hydrogenase B-type cytochrome subunit [Stenotrophomonas maltophilia]
MSDRILVWDLPLRLFHWLLAACVSLALLTGWLGGAWIDWHARLGLAIVGLLSFRLAWGLCGSTHARFSALWRAIVHLRDYLGGGWKGIGHNPLGSLSVVAFLLLLAAQACGGLISTDDIAFGGPLQSLVSSDLSETVSSLHRLGLWPILALIILHLGAIAWHTRIKHHALVPAMISGYTQRTDASQQSARGGNWPALLAALIFAGLMVWLASGTWIPAPPPATTPAW